MVPKRFMLIAGEPSGDALAAELVKALASPLFTTHHSPLTFFGAGGAQMAAAGVEVACDMTQHSVIGLWEVVRNYGKFKRLFDQLVALALECRPDAIVCVDFSGFNRRFARQLRWELAVRRETQWQPRLVQYVSPQVWASRPGRARAMARDFDLLLAIFPFEKAWYAERAPQLRVEFVGHPVCDRFKVQSAKFKVHSSPPLVLLLPGSRVGELKRHLPVMLGAWEKMQSAQPGLRARMVLPDENLAQLARTFPRPAGLEIQAGGLADALAQADLALASTGTVTMECAYFGVPTVALYKTSWSTYEIGRRIIQVKFLAMPNLLANEPLFPEFIQRDATPQNMARAALELLGDEARRTAVRTKLRAVVSSLGGPGASGRAARAILGLLDAPRGAA